MLLINDSPAVRTNFIAFMYAQALYFSPFSQTKANTTNVKYELKSLVSLLLARGLLSGEASVLYSRRGAMPPRWLAGIWPSEALLPGGPSHVLISCL